MKFEWIPVTPDTVPDKTKEATELYYLVTFLHDDNNAREVVVSEWGPVVPDRLEAFKENPLYKDYIFDGWAFGDLWSSGIDTPDRAIAWSYMPDAYMGEIVRKNDAWEE